MTGYQPSSPAVVAELAILLAATIVCGFALTRRPAAWAVLVAGEPT